MTESIYNSTHTGAEVDAAVEWVGSNIVGGLQGEEVKADGPIGRCIRSLAPTVMTAASTFGVNSDANGFPYKAVFVFDFSRSGIAGIETTILQLKDNQGNSYQAMASVTQDTSSSFEVTVYSNSGFDGNQCTLSVLAYQINA